MAVVAFNEVDKVYDNGVQAVFDLTLDIHDGELLVLIGPSCCGKERAPRRAAGCSDLWHTTCAAGRRPGRPRGRKE